MSKLARVLTTGLAGLGLLALSASAGFAAGDPPKPKKCSEYKEGSASWKKCMASSGLTDEDAYALGYWLAKNGETHAALEVLRSIGMQSDPRVQTMIGFSLRQLGQVDEAMGYYLAALRQSPGATTTRQYLGEAYLQKGDVAKAREQLGIIAGLCGTTCEDYQALAGAIAKAQG